MSNDIVLKVENISKQYRLGYVGTKSLKDDLIRRWHKIRGLEDPFLKIGEKNDRSKKSNSDYVWALKDISLEVREGEVLGIIGKNGAGKSTLLKLLSKVTGPTTGKIKVSGRIASLLEVGTGFHPELTGKENIFLNGAILGMTKKEIRSKYDEIVDFSGVERYLDTPVKRYSSGMYVRLAFAVAAHLDPEILIVDEVLAVGDVAFQKKAIGKMQDISKKSGRTVLFVSHNMGSVKNISTRGILLKHGGIETMGPIDDVLDCYLKSEENVVQKNAEDIIDRSGTQSVTFSSLSFETGKEGVKDTIFCGGQLLLKFKLKVNDKSIKKINIGFSIHNAWGDRLFVLYSGYQGAYFEGKEEYLEAKCLLEDLNLSPGVYQVIGRIEANGLEADWPKESIGTFNIIMGDFYNTGSLGFTNERIPLLVKGEWE